MTSAMSWPNSPAAEFERKAKGTAKLNLVRKGRSSPSTHP